MSKKLALGTGMFIIVIPISSEWLDTLVSFI